jgi:formylglycine-generating enzyme
MRNVTFASISLLTVACNSLLGIDEHQLAPQGGSTGGVRDNSSGGARSTSGTLGDTSGGQSGTAENGGMATTSSRGTLNGGATSRGTSEAAPAGGNSGGIPQSSVSSGGTTLGGQMTTAGNFSKGEGGMAGATFSRGGASQGGMATVGGSTPGVGGTGRGGVAASGSSSLAGAPYPTGGAAGKSGDGTAVGVLNQPCSGDPPYACAGHAQKLQLVCSAGKWAQYGSCENGYNCDTTPGSSAGSCAPIINWCSAAGTRHCNGAVIEQCGLDLVTMSTAMTCSSDRPICFDAATETCVACTPNSKRCDPVNTNSAELCNSSGQWGTPTACVNQTCVDGACQGECVYGQKRCDAAGSKGVQTCDATGYWSSPTACATSALCVSGECVPCGGTGGPAMVGLPIGYCIDRTEVTCAQYRAWLDTNASTSTQIAECAWNDSFVPQDNWQNQTPNSDYPVAYVDWCDAYAYCKGVGKRLCGRIGGTSLGWADFTDASRSQWYAACTSNGQNKYPYGQTYQPGVCNDSFAGYGILVEAGTMSGCHSSFMSYASVYDLSGNAWEWEDCCNDATRTAQCRTRGGFYKYSNAEPLACAFEDVAVRDAAIPYIGIRCCSP